MRRQERKIPLETDELSCTKEDPWGRDEEEMDEEEMDEEEMDEEESDEGEVGWRRSGMKKRWVRMREDGLYIYISGVFCTHAHLHTSTGPLKIQTNIRHTRASGKVSTAMLWGKSWLARREERVSVRKAEGPSGDFSACFPTRLRTSRMFHIRYRIRGKRTLTSIGQEQEKHDGSRRLWNYLRGDRVNSNINIFFDVLIGLALILVDTPQLVLKKQRRNKEQPFLATYDSQC